MADWTRARVEERLESATEVMRALPSIWPKGYFSARPEYFHIFADKVGQEPAMRRPRPPPRAITEAEEEMLWLRWLEPELGKLVWARVSGSEWKPICWQIGISRPTAYRRWEYGLNLIVWRLNAGGCRRSGRGGTWWRGRGEDRVGWRTLSPCRACPVSPPAWRVLCRRTPPSGRRA